MSLEDDLTRTAREVESTLDDTLAELDAEDRELLLEHLRGPTPATRISRALTNLGYPHDPKTVQRWRRIDRSR